MQTELYLLRLGHVWDMIQTARTNQKTLNRWNASQNITFDDMLEILKVL